MSEESWRLFVALPVPDDVRRRIGRALEPARRDLTAVRWSRPETWHLTLRFLGERRAGERPEIERRLRAAAALHGRLELTLDGGGVFRRYRGAVLWIGYEPAPELRALAATVRGAGAHRPFRPHLTVGRCRERLARSATAAFLESAAVLRGLTYPVSRVVLFRSELAPDGARHHELATFPLRRPEGRAGSGAPGAPELPAS